MATRRTTKATAPVEVDEDIDELEELEDDSVEETAPKKKGAAAAVTFGVADLAAHLSEKHDKKITTRELRMLIRKLARDGRVDREIIPGNRSRYDWSGLNDPEVKRIIKAYESGELEADKQEKLAELKKRGEAKRAAKKAAAAAASEEEDEDEDEDE
jgi:hypothetical protein